VKVKFLNKYLFVKINIYRILKRSKESDVVCMAVMMLEANV